MALCRSDRYYSSYDRLRRRLSSGAPPRRRCFKLSMEYLDFFVNVIITVFNLLFSGVGFFSLLVVSGLAVSLAYIIREVISL